MDNRNPFEFRVGSSGCGLMLGCGAGIGILTPVSLHSIPVVGQLASSLSSSLRQVDASLGGIGWKLSSKLNSRVQPIGLKAGAGCGVMIGAGYGVGLMLKPNALTSLADAIKSKLPADLRQKLESHSQQQNPVSAVPIESSLAMSSPPMMTPQQQHITNDKLEKEVSDLTKLVLKQQLALDELKSQIESLEQTVLLSQQEQRNTGKRK